MSWETLPADLRRLILGSVNYRTVQALACTCKSFYQKITQDDFFWKLVKSQYFPQSVETVLESYYSAVLKLMKARWTMALNIIELVFRNNGQIYGGFVRDYISRRRIFTDIDIHFAKYTEFTGFSYDIGNCGGFQNRATY